jgi:hypothetical protein
VTPTQLAPECGLVDVVDEGPLAVELDHRQPFAVARLELRIPADVDLLQSEPELGLQPLELRPRALAQVTSLRVEERDARYGYRPRITVASATR